MNSRKKCWWIVFALILMLGTVGMAQVPNYIAIESGNGGSVFSPTDPKGFLNSGPYVWISDSKGIQR